MAQVTNQDFPDYNLMIISKHIDATDALKAHILDKLKKLERLTDQIIDVQVRLNVEKLAHYVEITMKFSHFKVQTHATTTDLYASIDQAVEKMQSTLRKWKGKIQKHHSRKPDVKEIEVAIYDKPIDELDEINDDIENENQKKVDGAFALPKIVKNKKIPMKMLRADEAIMKMELSKDNFMVFKSEETQKMMVIYRRRDGSYGIIDPK